MSLELLKKMNLHQEEYVCTETRGDEYYASFVKLGSKKGKNANIIELKTTINYIGMEKLVSQLPSLFD